MKKSKSNEFLEKEDTKIRPQELSDGNMENVSGGFVRPNGKGKYNIIDNKNFQKVNPIGSTTDLDYNNAKIYDELWNHEFGKDLKDTLRRQGW